MSTSHLIGTSGLADLDRLCNPDLVELVDALVEAVDLNRWAEIDRLRAALEPLGVAPMFDAELRLNGIASGDEWCICGGADL